jgi:pilus assembly protein Flp/PilA
MIMNLEALQPLFYNLIDDESGQDLIDYALLAACVGLAIGAATRGLDNSVKNDLNTIGNTLTNSVL